MRFGQSLRNFLTEEDATTAVEYCVMIAMILLSIILAIYATGGGVLGWWTNINTEMSTHGF